MPQYPGRIRSFKKWSQLKIDSGQVGLGDKSHSRTKRTRRLRRLKRLRRKKVQE